MKKERNIAAVIILLLTLFVLRNFFYVSTNRVLVDWSLISNVEVQAYRYFEYSLNYLSLGLLSFLLAREYLRTKSCFLYFGVFFTYFFFGRIIILFIDYDFMYFSRFTILVLLLTCFTCKMLDKWADKLPKY